MPPDDAATAQVSGPDPKQAAYEALVALRDASDAAANNPANSPEAQAAAFDAETAAEDQLQALDLAVFTGNTVQLQAAAAALDPGMDQLKALKTKIEAISNDLKEAATIVSYIDKAVSAFAALH